MTLITPLIGSFFARANRLVLMVACGMVMAGWTAAACAQDTADAVEVAPMTMAEQIQSSLNEAFGKLNGYMEPVLFFDMSFGRIAGGVPLLVAVLLLGGIFFTFRFGLINLRMFGHGLAVVRGRYDDPSDPGEVSHFQALTSALSATVGLGNIAGVALAISAAGPGAVFWMWVVAFFGMSSKFASCTLAQAYRTVEDEGDGRAHVLGGPMLYLSKGLRETLGPTWGGPLGRVLAIAFALFAIGGALGGGNLFQSNQTAAIFSFVLFEGSHRYDLWFGLGMALLVGLVIVGGIRRIGEVTCRIVPAMCLFYCAVCLIILATHAAQVPAMLGSIFREAFTVQAAGVGGLIGILVQGVKRGAFSNEAGLGSAAIAHSAAKTDEPVREGVVAMLGPFIDTMVVCTMTAMTILITQNQISDVALEGTKGDLRGAAMTAEAFGSLHAALPIMLCIAVLVFAYSTMISWCYYGERASEYLLGKAGIWPFRVVFLTFAVLGPMLSIGNVVDFTDLLILSMAYPNILGLLILSPKVAALAKDYTRRLRAGEMVRHR